MRRPKGIPCHQCAPKEWRRTPSITGDYDFDESMMHNRNRDMQKRIKLYTTHGNAYSPRSGYNGYDGYHGDD